MMDSDIYHCLNKKCREFKRINKIGMCTKKEGVIGCTEWKGNPPTKRRYNGGRKRWSIEQRKLARMTQM